MQLNSDDAQHGKSNTLGCLAKGMVTHVGSMSTGSIGEQRPTQRGACTASGIRHSGLQVADLAIISALLDDLRGHPVGGANEGVALAHGVAQLRRHPKVSHLHLPGLRQKDVATLDVPVNL